MFDVRSPGILVPMGPWDWETTEGRYDMTEEDLKASSVFKRVTRALKADRGQRRGDRGVHEATVLKVKKNDRRPSELGHARASHA